MKIGEDKELELLIKAIEESSKHARNLLFILVVTSLYVLLAAYSESLEDKLKLPVLAVDVQTQQFNALSPMIILGVYLSSCLRFGTLEENRSFRLTGGRLYSRTSR